MKTRAWTTRPSAAGATVKATAARGRSDRVQLHARQSRRWPSAAAVLILCAVASCLTTTGAPWAAWAVCDAMPPLPTTNTTSAVAVTAAARILNHVSMAVVFRLLAADRRCQAPSRPSIAGGVTHRTHCRKERLCNDSLRTCFQGFRSCETISLNQSDWQYRSAMLIGDSSAVDQGAIAG